MSGCMDSAVTQVPRNLTVAGFLKLVCSGSLVRWGQSISSLFFRWPYCQGFGLWLAAGKMSAS